MPSMTALEVILLLYRTFGESSTMWLGGMQCISSVKLCN